MKIEELEDKVNGLETKLDFLVGILILIGMIVLVYNWWLNNG